MPAKKITFVATFADNTFIYRNTSLDLKFGWRAFGHDSKGNRHDFTGFSSRRDLADKAANAGLGRFSHNPTGVEVVALTQVDAKEWKAELIRRQPFRVKFTYDDGRSHHVGGDGNQDARFATVFDAQKVIDRLAKSSPTTTYQIVDDTPKAKATKTRSPKRNRV